MFRVKVFHAGGGSHAYTAESKDLNVVSKWADDLKATHYPNHIITIQQRQKGIWQDWCLI